MNNTVSVLLETGTAYRSRFGTEYTT